MEDEVDAVKAVLAKTNTASLDNTREIAARSEDSLSQPPELPRCALVGCKSAPDFALCAQTIKLLAGVWPH